MVKIDIALAVFPNKSVSRTFDPVFRYSQAPGKALGEGRFSAAKIAIEAQNCRWF